MNLFSLRDSSRDTDYGLRYNTLVLSINIKVTTFFNSFYTRALYRITTIQLPLEYILPTLLLPILSSFTKYYTVDNGLQY